MIWYALFRFFFRWYFHIKCSWVVGVFYKCSLLTYMLLSLCWKLLHWQSNFLHWWHPIYLFNTSRRFKCFGRSIQHGKKWPSGPVVASWSRYPRVRGSVPPLGTPGNVSENQFLGSTQAMWGNMSRWHDHRKVPSQWEVTHAVELKYKHLNAFQKNTGVERIINISSIYFTKSNVIQTGIRKVFFPKSCYYLEKYHRLFSKPAFFWGPQKAYSISCPSTTQGNFFSLQPDLSPISLSTRLGLSQLCHHKKRHNVAVFSL